MKNLIVILTLLSALLVSAQQLETVDFNGTSRTMMVYEPQNLSTNRPLVISLHGAGQDAAYQRDQTKWNNCADTANILVVYPNAINKFWDTSGQSDINFISWIIDKMHERYQIDLNRVYISGFSLGGMMTYHCMEHLGNKVAAFGPVSGVRFDNRAPQSPRRVPFIHTHGTGDDVFKWGGDPWHAAGGYPSIPEYVENWAIYEGLTEKEEINPYPSTKPNSIASLTIWRSTDPEDNIEIALLALKDKGHWHSEDLAAGVSTTQEIWRFCKRYSLQPQPPTITQAEPENLSFDLPTSNKSFSFVFSDVADITTVSANLLINNESIILNCTETENSAVLNFNVPENETLTEGKYTLVISGIKNPEGGKEQSASFTYYYGPSEYGNQIKEAFAQIYEYACQLYEQSEDATAMSVVNARKRLKKYIDKYVDFSSTAPSDYAKATENLSKNFEIIEEYIETLGIINVSNSTHILDTKYFTIDGVQINSPQSGITIVVNMLSNGCSSIQKIYR